MSTFEWDQVRLLLTVLRAPTTEQAAALLHVDRSTVSRRLLALEKHLGVLLFARTRDGLRPTPAAVRLRPLAEQMEAIALTLSDAAKATSDGVSGIVRLATTDALAQFFVAEGLLALSDRHPQLTVNLLAGNRPLDIARGEADLAVRVSVVRQAALRVRCLARNGVGLFASPDYLRRRGVARSRRTFRDHDVLLPAGELARLPETEWLASRPGVRVVFRSNSMPALIAAAVAGRGIVPLGLAWGQRVAGLEQVLALDQIPRRPLWLVTRAEKPERAGVRVVGDFIVARFADGAGR